MCVCPPLLPNLIVMLFYHGLRQQHQPQIKHKTRGSAAQFCTFIFTLKTRLNAAQNLTFVFFAIEVKFIDYQSAKQQKTNLSI